MVASNVFDSVIIKSHGLSNSSHGTNLIKKFSGKMIIFFALKFLLQKNLS